MSQKFTSTIAGASIFISLLGLLSRGLGFIREMVFANNFGLETSFDIYLVGAVLPTTINSIILYIGQNFFVPGFQKIKSENPEESKKYFKQSFFLFIGSGIIIAILLFFLSDLIINNYMQDSSVKNKEIAAIIFRIFLFTLPFSAGISILSALLQSVYEFKYPPISVFYLNISIIIMIFAFSDKIGIYVIPVGYLAGTLLQFLYLHYKSRKYIELNLIPHRQQFQFLKSMLGSALLIILLIESIGQLYSIIDRYFYTQINPGGIASLNYAYIIFILPISIFSISLATAIFPKITQAIYENEKNNLKKIFNDSISVNILIFMPLTFVLFYFGETMIKIAFERGKFIGESTAITYNVLKCYSISIVFYSVYTVLNKMFYSLNLVKLLLVITIMGIILKMIFNFLLVEHYQQDGLAISTSISFIFFFSVSYLVINRKLEFTDKSPLIKEFCFYFMNSCISLLIIKTLSNIFPGRNIIAEIFTLFIFIFIYLFNLILVEHKILIILNQVFPSLNLNRLMGKSLI